MIEKIKEECNVDLKKACKICGISRSVYYYQKRIKGGEEIEKILYKLSKEHRRWGFGKMFGFMKNKGCVWNHKKVYRIYCELKLNLRKKPRKRLPSRRKGMLLQPLTRNYSWSIDFMSDAFMSGRKFRTLNVLDDYNREVLGLKVGTSLPANTVTNFLDDIAMIRGYPRYIRTDNGPEFLSKKFVEWSNKKGIVIQYIQPGKPAQNAYIERFNRTYREDVLDANLFSAINEVQIITDEWLEDYNNNRPHESLGNKSPIEFARSREPKGLRTNLKHCPKTLKLSTYGVY